MTAPEALRRISSLYVSALNLPVPFADETSEDLAEAAPPPESEKDVAARAAELPLQFYWEVFDPIATPPEEPVAGSIPDDLCDIYRAVARGLVLFEEGNRGEALWEWAFHFRTHWGQHAAGALRTLHSYLSNEHPDGLSRVD